MKKRRDVDGGWAWAVAFGTFLSFLLLGGFTRSFGILYSAFLEMFGHSASTTSLIPAVRTACPIVVGPLSTTLSERYTERAVVIVGSLIISLGFIISFFATGLNFLIVSLGLIPGIGMALLISPTNVAMGKYFDKWRSRVLSLTSCGVCLGMVVVPLLLTLLIDTFSIRGTLLIFGGICLNLIITGAVQRPMTPEVDNKHVTEEMEMTESAQDRKKLPSDMSDSSCSKPENTKNAAAEACENATSGTLHHFEEQDSASEHICNIDKRTKDATTRNRGIAVKGGQLMLSLLRDLFDMTLMKNPVFLIFLISVTLSDVTYINQSIYFVALVESRGISRDCAAIVLSVIGGCDVIGRLTAGFLADKRPILPHHIMCVCGIITGVVCCVFPLARRFEDFVGLSVVFALVSSAPTLLNMPALAHSLGVASIARGLGLGMFFRGVFTAVSPPLFGLVKDITGSYDHIFPIIGVLQIGGGLILLLEPVAKRRMDMRMMHNSPACSDQIS